MKLIERNSKIRYFLLSILFISIVACVSVSFVPTFVFPTKLPNIRPLDFTITRYAGPSLWSGSDQFTISTTQCFYRLETRDSSQETQCEVTDAELDELYNVIRENAFDQIQFLGFPDSETCTDSSGVSYIEITVEGKSYRKDDPNCRLVFTGVTRWNKIDELLSILMHKWELL